MHSVAFRFLGLQGQGLPPTLPERYCRRASGTAFGGIGPSLQQPRGQLPCSWRSKELRSCCNAASTAPRLGVSVNMTAMQAHGGGGHAWRRQTAQGCWRLGAAVRRPCCPARALLGTQFTCAQLQAGEAVQRADQWVGPLPQAAQDRTQATSTPPRSSPLLRDVAHLSRTGRGYGPGCTQQQGRNSKRPPSHHGC